MYHWCIVCIAPRFRADRLLFFRAPFHYFVHWIAGISIAMMNKMGSWNMLVDYGFKSVSDYLYHYEISTLKCFISESDENNASR